MKKIILGSLIAASVMFGTDAKPLNDGPYVLQDNAGSSNKGSLKKENTRATDDLNAIKDYLGLPNKTVEREKTKASPLYTPIKATLLSGYVFALDLSVDNSLDSSALNPLIFKDENSCIYMGSATYSISSERVNVVLGYKSCFINNQLIESDIKGFVTENLMSGVKAKVEYSNKIVAEVLSGRNVELFITEVKSSKNININEITGGTK